MCWYSVSVVLFLRSCPHLNARAAPLILLSLNFFTVEMCIRNGLIIRWIPILSVYVVGARADCRTPRRLIEQFFRWLLAFNRNHSILWSDMMCYTARKSFGLSTTLPARRGRLHGCQADVRNQTVGFFSFSFFTISLSPLIHFNFVFLVSFKTVTTHIYWMYYIKEKKREKQKDVDNVIRIITM